MASERVPGRGLVNGIVYGLIFTRVDELWPPWLAGVITRGELDFDGGADTYIDAITQVLASPDPADPFHSVVNTEAQIREFLGQVLHYLKGAPHGPRPQRVTDAEYEPGDWRRLIAGITRSLSEAPMDERSLTRLADLILGRKSFFAEGTDAYLDAIDNALASPEKLNRHCGSVDDSRVRGFLVRLRAELAKPVSTDPKLPDVAAVLATCEGTITSRRRQDVHRYPQRWRGLVDGIVDELSVLALDTVNATTFAEAIIRRSSYLIHGPDAYFHAIGAALAAPEPIDPFPLGAHDDEELRAFLTLVRNRLPEPHGSQAPLWSMELSRSDIRNVLDP